LRQCDFAYSVFGLSLGSNLRIPGLQPTLSRNPALDVEVVLDGLPFACSTHKAGREALIYVSPIRTESGEHALRIWTIADGAFLRLEYFDGMRFWLDREGKTVWASWPDSSSLEDAATYLLGPVFGLLLRLRGVTCLHASAVVFGDRAVAFVGGEGAGKSTTAAAFARRGHAVLSDDIVALVEFDGIFHVMPAYPYLSLWPDSVEMLYGPGKALPSFSASFDKRFLSLAGNNLRFKEQSLPLGAVFFLSGRTTDSNAPLLENLPPKECLLALVANSYATNLLTPEMRAREFELLGRVLALVPCWRLRPHVNASRINRMCDLIQEACARLPVRPLLSSFA
jgi:hypothetical protein